MLGGSRGRSPPVLTTTTLDRDLYMRIALELHLKRLLVRGSSAYTSSVGFSERGLSPRHNPEFTLLESYQAYADCDDVMRLVEDMFVAAANAAGRPVGGTYQEEIDLTPPYKRERMADPVLEHTGKHAVGQGSATCSEMRVQARIRQPTFVIDYPIRSLWPARATTTPVCQRFELVPRPGVRQRVH
jgi:lysyl-tRNA synthetase class 2